MSKFIGETIDEEVIKQIETRQKLKGRDPLYVDNYLKYQSGNNAWVRVISGVDVDGEPDDAKNFVLSGGALKWNGTEFIKNSKFNPTQAGDNSRYGFNDSYGVRPESGLTSFSIKHRGRFGTIREANIGFALWKREDLVRAENLFFRPGFTVIVEWGNAGYVDNDSRFEDKPNIKNTDAPGTNSFFTSTENITNILGLLSSNIEESDYNYDAFIGFISNFSWSLRPDGGYDCTITALTQGSILESLKIVTGENRATGGIFSQFEEKFFSKKKVETPDEESDAEEEEPGFFRKLLDDSVKGIKNRLTPADTDLELNQRLSLLHFFCLKVEEIDISRLDDGYIEYTNFINETFNKEKGKSKSLQNGRWIINKEVNPIVDFLKKEELHEKDFRVFGFNGRTSGDGSTAFRYISLKTFLALVNISFLNGSKDTNLPSFSIKEEDYKNYATFKNHFSFDPSLVILPKVPEQPELNVSKKTLKTITDRKGTTSNEVTKDGSECYVKVLQGNVSDSILKDITEEQKTNILNIFISTKLIKQSLDSVFTPDNIEGSDLLTFIRSVLNTINQTLGNINELDVHFQDMPGGTITVVDRKELNRALKSEEVKKLPVTGPFSTVSSISLQSKISNELSSMISISSTGGADNNTNSNAGLVAYNEGKRDRFKKDYDEDPNSEKTKTEPSEETQADKNKKREKFFINVFRAYAVFNNTQTDQRLVKGVFKEKLFTRFKTEAYSRTRQAYFGELKKEKISPQDIIPFEIAIKLDGISGLKIGQVFKLQDSDGILPENYKDASAIIITGLDSTIENGKWYTNVRGQTFMLGKTIETQEVNVEGNY